MCSIYIRIGMQQEIPEDVKKEALRIYKDVKDRGITRGLEDSLVMDACVFVASKRLGKPIIYLPSEDKKQGAEYKRRLYSVVSKIAQLYPLYTHNTSEYFYSLVDIFSLPPEIKKEAKELIHNNMDLLNGRNPKGVVGAIIYIVAQRHHINIYQKIIADKLGITEVTIRHRLKELRKRIMENV